MLDDVRPYHVKRVRCVCKPAILEMCFELLHKSLAGRFAGEFNCNAVFVIRCRCRRCAKFAATYSAQSGQRLPTNLINHAAYFALVSNFTAQAKFPSVSRNFINQPTPGIAVLGIRIFPPAASTFCAVMSTS